MLIFFYLVLGMLLAWPAGRLLQRLRHRAAWMRRLPGFQPRHLRVYTPHPAAPGPGGVPVA